jgi:hypothetical protein
LRGIWYTVYTRFRTDGCWNPANSGKLDRFINSGWSQKEKAKWILR